MAVLRQRLEANRVRENQAKHYLQQLQPLIDYVKESGNLLDRTPEYDDLYQDDPPDVVLGTLEEGEEVPFGIRFLDRPRHRFYSRLLSQCI